MSLTRAGSRSSLATVVLIGVVIMPAGRSEAQAPPALVAAARRAAAITGQPATAGVTPTAARGPLARLLRNPNTAGGLPPYALADQAGTIQRYVEPVPGINLEPYVGAVVTVRYDTGRTLLATQLDLPDLPTPSRGGAVPGLGGFPSGVRLAQHVQPLQPGTVDLPDGPVPPDPAALDASPPPWTVSAPPPGVEPIYLDSMAPGMGVAPGMAPCPSCPPCGGTCETFGCGPMVCGAVEPAACPPPEPWRLYADVDLYFPRVRLTEDLLGKLSEHYDLTPRVIVGFETPLLDGRVRYWRYHETTPILTGGDVRFEFDVLDIEATSRLQGRRTDVTLAGGLRLADIDVNLALPAVEQQLIVIGTGSDLIGLTLAADVQTRVFASRFGQLGVVYGGRLSLLGGDWGGDFQDRDDNLLVHELYGGVEYLYSFRRFDVHARATAEWQHWHSDILGGAAIGFFGPCAQVGIDF